MTRVHSIHLLPLCLPKSEKLDDAVGEPFSLRSKQQPICYVSTSVSLSLSLSLSLSHFVFAPTLVRLVSLLADGLIALKDLLPVWFPSFRLVSIKLHCCTGTRVYTRSDLLWPTPLFLLTLLLILARPLHLFSCIYLSPESSERIETVWSGSPRCATPVFFAKRKKTVKREKNRH